MYSFNCVTFLTCLCTFGAAHWLFQCYLDNILDTQPWDTLSCLEMSQGRTPLWASSTILCRTTSGRGRPFTKTPPSWLTPPWPERKEHMGKICVVISLCYKVFVRVNTRVAQVLKLKIFSVIQLILLISFKEVVKFRWNDILSENLINC